MAEMSVKDLMVPLSDYVIVSENETIGQALRILRKSHNTMPSDQYYHRAVLVKNDAGEIVGKLGYHGFLAALDAKYENLDEMKTLAGSGITKKDINKEMRELGFWKDNLPLLKQKSEETAMKEVMVTFKEHVDEDGSLTEAMHLMVRLNVLSLLTTKDDHITGVIRLSDLFEAITDYVIAAE